MNKRLLFAFLFSFYIVQGLFSMEDFRTSLSKHYFYNAIYRCDYVWTENHLKAGYDPEKCSGDAGWVDSIPLKVLVEGFNGTFYAKQRNKDYVNVDDVRILELLLDAGININRLPYIWDRVYRYDNWHIENLNGKNTLSKELQILQEKCFVDDSNRLLKALLENGADPNMKGHPFPYSHSRRLLFFTDKRAFKYFNSPEATTPLYEAIKKGIKWESQVDLLLEYGAILDESCLEAAQLSGNEQMMEKIQKLWKEKNK